MKNEKKSFFGGGTFSMKMLFRQLHQKQKLIIFWAVVPLAWK
jgi:hypothetical protein